MSLRLELLPAAASVIGVSWAFGDLDVWSWVGCLGGSILAASVVIGSIWARLFRWAMNTLAALLFMPGIMHALGVTHPGVGMSLSALFALVFWHFMALWTTDGHRAARALLERGLGWISKGEPK